MDHIFKHLPWVFRLGDAELLNFFELMDSKDTPGVLSMSACLFSEAWWRSSVLDGQAWLLNPLSSVHCWNGLLWSSNKIEVLIFSISWNLVELVIEIAELAGFSHNLLLQEERRLNEIITSLWKEGDSVVDERVVQENSNSFQEVASMSCDLLSSFWVISSQSLKNFMMIQASSLVGDLNVGNLTPSGDDFIVVLVVENGNWIMNNVSNWIDKLIDLSQQHSFILLNTLLLLLILILEFDLLSTGIFLVGFLLVPDDLADIVPFLLEWV